MARPAEGKVFMSFKRLLVVATVALAVSGVGPLFAQPQGESAAGLSLGDFARQQKAQRERAAKKPAKEFSNDNLPARPAAGALTVAAGMSTEGEEKTPEGTEAAASGQESTGAEVAKTPEAGTSESAPAHDEAYYREAMRKLQDRRAMHERQLSVLEQKLSQGEMVFYPDPNKTLAQESTSFRSEINKLRDEVAKKQQDIADDDKAMDDLREQLRREGGPSGWLR
jgi:hypothetical protein